MYGGLNIAETKAKLKELADEGHEKEVWDLALDLVEKLIENSKTKIDDIILLPIIKIIRNRIGVSDND